jgi:hypothetical protein
MFPPGGAQVEPLLQQTTSPACHLIGLRILLHMFTHGTDLLPLLEEAPGLVDFVLRLHMARAQCRADDCARYPRVDWNVARYFPETVLLSATA